MKQMRITAPFVFQAEEVPVPEINSGEVLLKIDCIGVCASDMQIYHGKHKFMTFPVILGHEAAATVEKTGAQVSAFAAGDKVTVEPQISPLSCLQAEKSAPKKQSPKCFRLMTMQKHLNTPMQILLQ